MGGFFGSLLTWFLDLLRGKTPAASRVEVQADRAAVAETKLATESQTASVQSAIAQAVTEAPKDQAGVVKALRDGEF